MRSSLRVGLFGVAALLVAAACGRREESQSDKPTRSVGSVIVRPPAEPAEPARAADTNMAEQARLTRLEREARALAKTDGCGSLGSCRTAPVGWRGCGGPRTYIPYCAATTDTVALFRKLAELEAAERAYNAKTGIVSTCEMRLPPRMSLDGKRCRLELVAP